MYFDTSITAFTRQRFLSKIGIVGALKHHVLLAEKTMNELQELRAFLQAGDKDSAKRLIENLNPSSVVKSILRNHVPLILEATETVRAAVFILSRSETGTTIVVVWGSMPSNFIVFIDCDVKLFATSKELRFEEVNSKDKGPMFALLWNTDTERSVLRSILKTEKNNITKLKT